MKTWEPTEGNGRAGIHGSRVLLALAGVAGLLALVLAIAALTARGENPLAYPTVIPPPPVAPATPANPGPDIFGPASDTGNANNTPTPPQTRVANRTNPDTNANQPTLTRLDCPAKIVTAMIGDGSGGIYVADEDAGIFHGVPKKFAENEAPSFAWTHLHAGEGTPVTADNIYSLCLDAQGRLWAGSARDGVFVYNGEKWGHYAVISDPASQTLPGPLGAHVVAITVNPKDRSVWSCDECGIDIYDTTTNTWRYLDQTSGLPLHPNGVAFDRDGTAYAATDSDGVAIAKPPYNHWHVIQGASQMSLTPAGEGIPSGLTNAVLVTEAGRLLVATDLGLAMSTDGGASFNFERGDEYADKIAGLYQPPRGYRAPPRAALANLLPGDHITTLAEDSSGNLWLGTWDSGLAIINESTGSQFRTKDDKALKLPSQYISAILCPSAPILRRSAAAIRGSAAILAADRDAATPRNEEGAPSAPESPHATASPAPVPPPSVLVAFYGAGVYALRLPAAASPARATDPSPGGLSALRGGPQAGANGDSATPADSMFASAPLLPKPAAAPSDSELAAMLKSLESVPNAPSGTGSPVVALFDDEITRGDWLGRYGRYWACLCAMDAPMDYVWGAGNERIAFGENIGSHHRQGDAIRYWVQWLYTTNPNSLEMPPTYLDSRVRRGLTTLSVDRRESEIDDHSETYPRTYEGPDIYFSLRIPNGQFILSLFDYNKDGEEAHRACRDYRVSVRRHAGADLDDISDFDRQPELAHTRINSFRNGVYKRFLVRGPKTLTVKLERNASFDTILCGAFVDTIDEEPEPYFNAEHVGSGVTMVSAQAGATTAASVPLQALGRLDKLRTAAPAVWAAKSRLGYAQLQRREATLAVSGANAQQTEMVRALGTCLYHLDYFEDWERNQQQQGLTTAREIEKSVRWDGVTDSCQGMGRQIVGDYLRSQRTNGQSSLPPVQGGQ